jgi:hypothetical protein
VKIAPTVQHCKNETLHMDNLCKVIPLMKDGTELASRLLLDIGLLPNSASFKDLPTQWLLKGFGRRPEKFQVSASA